MYKDSASTESKAREVQVTNEVVRNVDDICTGAERRNRLK
jgi:hypothetical protein